eukprot:3160457-Pyramimonas_sp.AAC.1
MKAIVAVLEATLGHIGAIWSAKNACNHLWANFPGGQRAGQNPPGGSQRTENLFENWHAKHPCGKPARGGG